MEAHDLEMGEHLEESQHQGERLDQEAVPTEQEESRGAQQKSIQTSLDPPHPVGNETLVGEVRQLLAHSLHKIEALLFSILRPSNPGGGDDHSSAGILQRLLAVNNNLRNENNNVVGRNRDLLHEASWFRKEITTLRGQNRELHEDVTTKSETNAELTSDNQLLKKTLEENEKHLKTLRHQCKMLEKEKHKLKSIITSRVQEKDEPLDEEVRAAFSKLREAITTLVHAVVTKETQIVTLKPSSTNVQRSFYDGPWRHLTSLALKRLRLRSSIWQVLFQQVFTELVYGVESSFERELGKLEVKLSETDDQERLKQVAEWRKRTLQCIDLLGSQSRPVQFVRGSIVELIKPLVKDMAHGKRAQIGNGVVELTESAYDFMIKTRKSKATFEILEIPRGTVVDGEEGELYEIDHFEGPQPDEIAGSKVAFTLFGALRKTDHTHGVTTILEKAKVVCTKQSPRG